MFKKSIEIEMQKDTKYNPIFDLFDGEPFLIFSSEKFENPASIEIIPKEINVK
jgi:hypothetical protein